MDPVHLIIIYMEKAYQPNKFEDKIYKNWEEKDLFNPDKVKKLRRISDDSFSIVLPPPNVTGTLHLGHAAMLAIEDLMVRFHRMKGFDTVWVPGTDHAAIATQNVVEKKLLKETGKTRHDLGREKFLAEVEKYIEQSKDTIHKQVRKMGSSLDWSREAYTLDETRSRAVKKVFKMMYDDGLIYRGYRIVNWCPRCHSTLADDEVEYKDEPAKLYYFKYTKDFPFPIASTRPETKLGDTAVAVNPEDKRYKKYIGQTFKVDFVGAPLKLKIIGDKEVAPGFGTGALGVTPAHSMVDYEMAQNHDLEMKKVIDEDGKMTEETGDFSGMTVLEAREAVVDALEKAGLMEKVEDVEHKLSVCYRCDTPVEPIPSLQWFVNVNKKVDRLGGKSLKEKAVEVVKNDEIQIIPDRFRKIYINWMENLHDWCISRQIWFGHRIPVWYKSKGKRKKENGKMTVKNEKSDKTEIFVGEEAPPQETNFVFLHGYKGSINEDFWPWLKSKLNEYELFAEDLPNPAEPELKEQMNFVINNAEMNENTVIIGHSLGCVLAMKLLEEKNIKIKKLILVAPPAQSEKFVDGKRREPLEKYCNWKFDYKKIKSLADDMVVLQDTNDSVVLQEDGEEIAKGLEAEHIKMKAPAPHFNCNKCEEIFEEIKDAIWTQDPDTLDTWFSSGLWTFTTLLEKDFKDFNKKDNPDLKRWHPTSVLETAYDIIFFWVARMILMTNYVMQEIPFEKVYLHGIIRDIEGDKMSKSKPETAIDPIEVGDKYGYDAVRLSLLIGSTPGNDITLYDEKISGFRNFVNKLWNISRFILQTVDDSSIETKKIKAQTDADKWILSKFNKVVNEVTMDLDNYQFSAAGEKLRDFTWNEFADWYLEIAKVEKGKDKILMYILKNLLRMWHPFVPFVTEAVWGNFNPKHELMLSHWPEANIKLIDEKDEKEFEKVKEIITAIRNLRAENNVEPGKKIKAQFIAKKKFKNNEEIIKDLARLETIEYVDRADKPAASAVVENIEIYLPLAGLIDIEKERSRLQKEIENVRKYIQEQEKKLKNREFTENAPKEVVGTEKKKLEEAKEKLEKLNNQLRGLE